MPDPVTPGSARPDVIIVGAGPVGAFAALCLGGAGCTVTVIERRAAVSRRPRAIGVHPPAARVLRLAGVDLGGAVEIRCGRACDRGRILADLRFDEPVLSLPQHRIERSLRRLLAALPTVTVRRGAAARLVTPGTGGIPGTRPAGARPVHAWPVLDLQGERLSAPVVIAADGADSGLRAAAGIRWLPAKGRARYLMADLDSDPDGDRVPEAGAVLWFTAAGVVESFPLPDSRRRWVVRSRSASTAEDLAGLVARRTGCRVHPGSRAISVFTARQHLAERWVRAGLILLGDAAHEISPIGGQGMNLGLLDAARLAGPVQCLLAGDASALAGWERAGLRRARRVMRQARFNMAVGAPAPPALQPLRRGGIRLLGLQQARLAAAFTMARL